MDPRANQPSPSLPTGSGPHQAAVSGEPASDGVYVTKTLAGDRKAFDELIKKYQRQAVAVSYRLLGNMQDALEVTQDAFLKSFTSLQSLQKGDAFGGWLMRIVANLSLNHRRSRKNKRALPLDDLFGPSASNSGSGSEWMARSGDPVRNLESQELGVKLQKALAELPEKQRLALVMFTLEQLPQKEVAEALQCSVEAVKWHVFQARKKLKDLLKENM